MRTLVKNPGKIRVSQCGLQEKPNVYKCALEKLSQIDGTSTVLDVRPPIIMASPSFLGEYVVLEGHTRFYEAHKRGIGIEAELVTNKDDLATCPFECFETLSLSRCVSVLDNLHVHQREASLNCYKFISDF
ncbi:hypothetical protein COU60_02820 [Candidatus Pacearchaeota archaeon CG10_big_fil_rev_8_21_14_0_10_34_76]|nr:MAG: hypothetical protein COU60_02820 [Candidatus Pacearchaeota archaeon CG10_big_fil_rev_8_21_14_0_10_34_76]